jgi:hypothetical protein
MSITKDFYTVFVLTNENKPVNKLEETVFALRHGEEYKIKIENHHKNLRANASVSVDGKNIGYFRINADSSLTLERPADRDRRLTFYKRGTKEALKGGLESNNAEQGILRVTIEKEKESSATQQIVVTKQRSCHSCDGPGDDVVDCSFSMGGTALGGTSSQRFLSASKMRTADRVIIIRALMVVDDIVPL